MKRLKRVFKWLKISFEWTHSESSCFSSGNVVKGRCGDFLRSLQKILPDLDEVERHTNDAVEQVAPPLVRPA